MGPSVSSLSDSYVSSKLAGQRVALHLPATERCWIVIHAHQPVKTLPIKGLYGAVLPFDAFVRLMGQQARAEHRLRTAQERRARHASVSSP
jgi:hypothetical protein